MNDPMYIDIFRQAARQFDKQLLKQRQTEVAVVDVFDCVVLKLYKKSWATPATDPLTAESRIFFSIWVSNAAINEQKIRYNIHAFKLRQLPGYAIESRKFAHAFRAAFKPFEEQWPNVSVKYGPLTLMEGWLKADVQKYPDEIVSLANHFLAIEHLIDDTLLTFKK